MAKTLTVDRRWLDRDSQGVVVSDRWRGPFMATELEHYRYTVTAWVGRSKSRRKDLMKTFEATSIPLHGRPYSMTFVLPPLSTLFFKHTEEKL